jgi:uncharacterized protein (TIGR00162 family)
MEWVFSLVTEKKPKLENPILIEGLPGIGNVGKIVVDYMVEKLKAKKLYTVYSHYIPHSVFVNEDNIVEMPKIEIYYKKSKNKRDMLFLVGDTQPIDEPSCFSFCERLLSVISQHHCNEIVTIGGIGLQELPKEPKIFVTGNSTEIVSKYKTKKLSNELYGHVGPIVGVTGVLLPLAKLRHKDAIALLGETLGHPMFVGIQTAKLILDYFNKKFSLNVKIKDLECEIHELENELKAIDEIEMLNPKDPNSQQMGSKKKNQISYIG